MGSSSSGSRTVSSAASRGVVLAAVAVMLLIDQLCVFSGRRSAGIGQQLAFGRHLDVVKLRGIEPEDLLLSGDAEPRVVRELLGVWHLPVDEAFDLPFGFPDGVIAAEGHLVLT